MTYCDRCCRGFNTWNALYQHEANSPHHNVCGECRLDFSSALGLKEHWVQSPRHFYCQRCNIHLGSREQELAHYRDSHVYCEPCNGFFVNEIGLHEHRHQSPLHHYCAPCKRLFLSPSNLASHMNSSTHQPKTVHCPFRPCTQTFVSRSALILHLESGKCTSGVNRQVINRFIRENDTSNMITDPARMIMGPTAEVKYYASGASWNGNCYECYLCHRGFRSLQSLNAHLASPVHQDKMYLCPLSSCRQRFTTLSALCQHIEGEKCGVSKFRQVQLAMDSLVGGMRRLGM